MKLSSIFSPIHQGHQQLICPAQLGRTPKAGHLAFHYADHLLERLMLNSCQSFEIFLASVFDFFVSHVPIMAHLPLMQEVYYILMMAMVSIL
jgi:hypothetical protein